MYANDTRPRELYKTRAKLKPREECVRAGVWPTTGNYRATVFLISDTNEIPYRPLIRRHPLVLVINNLSGAQTCGRVNLMELITGRSYIQGEFLQVSSGEFHRNGIITNNDWFPRDY